jgi:hypothetical protein
VECLGPAEGDAVLMRSLCWEEEATAGPQAAAGLVMAGPGWVGRLGERGLAARARAALGRVAA